MYYLRTRPAANAIQFTVDHGVIQQVKNQQQEQDKAPSRQEQEDKEQAMACSLQNKEACIMCSA